MIFKTSFSFRNDKILSTKIGDNVFMWIVRINNGVARVLFVDDKYARIPIPDGFRIIDLSNKDAQVIPCHEDTFIDLTYSDNYSMLLHDKVIINVFSQRQWAVQGPSDRAVYELDN